MNRGSFAWLLVLTACGSSGSAAQGGSADAAGDAVSDATVGPDAAADAADAPSTEEAEAATDVVQALLALTSKCTVASNGQYSIHQGSPPTIDVCRLNGAFFWNSSMNVDCDGQTTTECNINTDPAYQNQTSFNQSDGQPLIAAKLPYVVVPLPSSRFDYMASGIKPGAVVAVIYGGKMNFGVFGDEGPTNLIGEASYAMAASLGVDPNPSTGGADSGATYIVFTGAGAVATPIEDHAAAVNLGQQLVTTLLKNN
jgi:hypothetical protein